MSQVVVCQDSLGSKRQDSLAQESKIDKDSATTKWQRSDVTKTLMIERVIALLFAPIVLLWALLLFCMGLAFALSLFVFKLFSKTIVLLKGRVMKAAGH